MDIKILGWGCTKADMMEKLVREVVSEMGVFANIEKVTGVIEVAQYGVLVAPAVVVDGEVKAAGDLPRKEEIRKWILH
jgi:small redox-active disulfide protein 2